MSPSTVYYYNPPNPATIGPRAPENHPKLLSIILFFTMNFVLFFLLVAASVLIARVDKKMDENSEYQDGKTLPCKEESKGLVSLEDIRACATEIVMREIEKHAADGVGRVDYALGSAGGTMVDHSEPGNKSISEALYSRWGMRSVSPHAKEMLTPSFGEPGRCFVLQGSRGFVTIRLSRAIVPEAITLEHVAESVAHDRSTAPKDCRITGWRAQQSDDSTNEIEKVLLAVFSYDLENRNVQTFKVSESVVSKVVNTIRLDFTSNHGNWDYTCIYRLRVHGHEPNLLESAAKLY